MHFANRRVTNLEEFKGQKVRGPTRIGSKFITALGGTAVQMPLPQVPESISKSVIDGAMVPWEGVPPIKLQEIAKYHLDNAPNVPRMSNTTFVIAMNQAKYDSLPPDLKKVIDANSGLRVVEADRQDLRQHDCARQASWRRTRTASSTRCRRPSTRSGKRPETAW